MAHELHGSMIVFLTAPFIVFMLRDRLVWLAFIFTALMFRYAAPYMVGATPC
jgi:hypothetical protein